MRPPTVRQIADALAPDLDRARYHREGDPAGVWLDSPRPVRRLGLALEAGRAPYPWAETVDAVLLHRPFGLWPARLPDGLGVLAVHRVLDDRFALGPNGRAAEALGAAADAEPLFRDGRDVGRVGRWAPVPLAEAERRVRSEWGGTEAAVGEGPREVGAVAFVGAMTAGLVEAAAERGVGLYVTGQLRKPGVAAVERHGVRVLAVGQDRSEAWGLRQIGALVRAAFPAVETVEVGLPRLGRSA